MTTAQVLFEQYKVLPPRIQQQFKKLVNGKATPAPQPATTLEDDDDDDSGDTIRISMKALHSSIKQIKLLKAGKITGRPIAELLKELDDDAADD